MAKSLEFTRLVWSADSPTDSFFLTASLRGICEDIIALEFLLPLERADRDRAVLLLLSRDIRQAVEAQKGFFAAVRPWQPVITAGLSPNGVQDELRSLATKLGWVGKRPWPTVWFMSKSCGRQDLYRYLYSATSKWVHFNPHVLMRMGWGGEAGKLDDSTVWHFTTQNFARYYNDFNRTYSLYLFLQLLRGPAAELVVALESQLESLDEILTQQARWPELVTFEEMNVKGPRYFDRALLRVIYEAESPEGPDES